ncbi:hypothetical protein J7L60_06715 [Candidatus Bathyarchaeota archaeon]|nr:hypothetical protein [Candidatus Bathyarchaeota archaeon]
MRERFQEIVRYLVDLKDTSELMMDLAYSALLLNSRELAEEVERLEERIDFLHHNFQLLVLSSRRMGEEAEDYLGLIRIGEATERIADAAAEIAEVVLRGVEPHPVLRLVIEDAEETVVRVRISEDSPLAGKTLKEARIPEQTGMWVLVMRRRDQWMRPKPGTVLQPGDVLIAAGYAEGEEDFRRLAGGEGDQS